MNLIAVQCSRSTDDEDSEPRIGVVIADDPAEAERLCEALYRLLTLVINRERSSTGNPAATLLLHLLG